MRLLVPVIAPLMPILVVLECREHRLKLCTFRPKFEVCHLLCWPVSAEAVFLRRRKIAERGTMNLPTFHRRSTTQGTDLEPVRSSTVYHFQVGGGAESCPDQGSDMQCRTIKLCELVDWSENHWERRICFLQPASEHGNVDSIYLAQLSGSIFTLSVDDPWLRRQNSCRRDDFLCKRIADLER